MPSTKTGPVTMPGSLSAKVLFQQPGRVLLDKPVQAPVTRGTEDHALHMFGMTVRDAGASNDRANE